MEELPLAIPEPAKLPMERWHRVVKIPMAIGARIMDKMIKTIL
jgi:hypothetical protein